MTVALGREDTTAVRFAGLFAAARKLLGGAVSAGVADGQGGSGGTPPGAGHRRRTRTDSGSQTRARNRETTADAGGDGESDPPTDRPINE